MIPIKILSKNKIKILTSSEFEGDKWHTIYRDDKLEMSYTSGFAKYGTIVGDWRPVRNIYEFCQYVFDLIDKYQHEPNWKELVEDELKKEFEYIGETKKYKKTKSLHKKSKLLKARKLTDEELWIEYFPDEEERAEWQEYFEDPETAITLHDITGDAGEAYEWYELFGDDYHTISEWRSYYSVDEARKLSKISKDLSEVREWLSYFREDNALEWSQYFNNPETAYKWYQAGYSPSEAYEWYKLGYSSPSEIEETREELSESQLNKFKKLLNLILSQRQILFTPQNFKFEILQNAILGYNPNNFLAFSIVKVKPNKFVFEDFENLETKILDKNELVELAIDKLGISLEDLQKAFKIYSIEIK